MYYSSIIIKIIIGIYEVEILMMNNRINSKNTFHHATLLKLQLPKS